MEPAKKDVNPEELVKGSRKSQSILFRIATTRTTHNFFKMKRVAFGIAFLFSLVVMTESVNISLPYVTLEGYSIPSLQVDRFLGIPYIQPGTFRRFTEGIPIDESLFPENAYFNASTFGNVCPQRSAGNIIGADDCLNLDVTKPIWATSVSKLPVMVWIYGVRILILDDFFINIVLGRIYRWIYPFL